MQNSFRQSMAWLHTWVGLVVGWVLFFVFVTGTAGYYTEAITRWMQPAANTSSARDIGGFAVAQRWLAAHAPQARMWGMDLPGREDAPLPVWWMDEAGARHDQAIDLRTGIGIEALPPAPLTGGGLALYRMHYALHYMPYGWGIRLVGVCTMLMLLAILSGVVTHKKIFADFFTFRPRKGQRSWLDAHNLISVTALPFFLMITWSGLVFFLYTYMPAGMELNFAHDRGRYEAAIHGEEQDHKEASAPTRASSVPMLSLTELVQRVEATGLGGPYNGIRVDLPGDAKAVANLFPGGHPYSAVSGEPIARAAQAEDEHHNEAFAHEFEETLIWLHEGNFAGPVLRALYFASGLLGCAMIATGLVLWTVKRRQKQLKAQRSHGWSDFGFRLVEALNIGTIAGLPTAIASYFLANRLLPLDVPERAEWEMHCLFITWVIVMLWAGVRAPGKAWVEGLSMAAMAFASVPVVNAAMTGRHLGISLPAGDWVYSGFDLVMLSLAAFFCMAAIRTRRKWGVPAPQVHGQPVEVSA